MKETISWNNFGVLDLRIGTILEASEFQESKKPAIKLLIDFGSEGIKKSSAQITILYSPSELIGRQIVALINLPAKQIANMMSECLVLGAVNQSGEVVLLQPDRKTENGIPIA